MLFNKCYKTNVVMILDIVMIKTKLPIAIINVTLTILTKLNLTLYLNPLFPVRYGGGTAVEEGLRSSSSSKSSSS
jgi:hypothetical protein